MENAPARKSEGAGTLVGDSPLSSKSAPLGKTLFERPDGSRFVTSGADAETLLKLMATPRGVTSTVLWPNTPGAQHVTTRLGAVVHRLRHERGVRIDTVMEPNVSRPGRHARYFLRDTIKRVPLQG